MGALDCAGIGTCPARTRKVLDAKHRTPRVRLAVIRISSTRVWRESIRFIPRISVHGRHGGMHAAPRAVGEGRATDPADQESNRGDDGGKRVVDPAGTADPWRVSTRDWAKFASASIPLARAVRRPQSKGAYQDAEVPATNNNHRPFDRGRTFTSASCSFIRFDGENFPNIRWSNLKCLEKLLQSSTKKA